ncbi:MAG: hypothetical protein IPP96_14050 [Chitinophagaceae bacterium]|nr:hypothetical protein [Chitinophagaceae bacterium]
MLEKKTFNVDFVAYPDFLRHIPIQKKNTHHCVVVKMSDNAEKIDEPVEVDTTRIPVIANNKIYAVIHSEDGQRIMIFKIRTRYQEFDMVSLLFDKSFKLVSKNRYVTDFNERRENCDNFHMAMTELLFSHETQSETGIIPVCLTR